MGFVIYSNFQVATTPAQGETLHIFTALMLW